VGVVDPTGRHPNALHPSQVQSLDIDAVVVCKPDAEGIPKGLDIWKLV
ncbi:MAG: hypothetical protein JRJ87_26250, partial [Deltaproteobacteria bacterium]|nr:hypothetical protein [Deltaproteobacteria bacterium]